MSACHDRPRYLRILSVRRRRLARLVVRRLGDWHQWLPSWGTSLLVHGIALLILALVYLGSTRGEPPRAKFDGVLGPPSTVLGQGVESLVSADVAGDPWTKGGSAEFPSFTFGPTDPGVKTVNRPALPPGAKLAATFTPPRIAAMPGMRLSDSVARGYHLEDMTAPFAGRDPEMKARLIRREGGTVESEMAVQAGLDWLARHQRADGAWTLDYHAQCSDPPCPDETPEASDTGATGLGLLPFLGAGHIHTQKSRYQDTVARGLAYLVSRQNEEGEIYIGGGWNFRFYSHAIATMALCEAYGLSKDPKLKGPAQRGIYFIAKSQNLDDGGWRYKLGQAGDTSVIGWQMFALRSGRLAGLDVPKRTLHGCRVFLDLAAADPAGTTYAYTVGGGPTPTMTAEALLCRQYLGWSGDHPALRKGAKAVWEDLQTSGQRNIYYWYYATQLLHNLGGKDWIAWNKRVRDGLVSMQANGPGCDRGSWDPTRPQADRWGVVAGRHFLTCLSILTLEVYYRWLPLYAPTEGEQDPKAQKAARDRPQARENPPARKEGAAGRRKPIGEK